jgi:hypothetical protein
MKLSLIPLLGVVVLLLFPQASEAGALADTRDPCEVGMSVTARKPIVIVLHKGLGKSVKGLYLQSDAIGVTVEKRRTGERSRVEWASIRKIKPKRSMSGFWAGMFIGGAIGAASALGGDGPSGTGLAVGFTAGGATLGALTGHLGVRPICETTDRETR